VPHADNTFEVETGGQWWRLSWHAGPVAPEGRAHGAAGICLADDGVVLISTDGVCWDFPAGRPDGGERWEEVLRREVREEACAVVTDARLLGFSRGRCLKGAESGLVLVRSIWLAQVRLLDWAPAFETRFRRVVPAAGAIDQIPPTYRPVWVRAFAQCGLA